VGTRLRTELNLIINMRKIFFIPIVLFLLLPQITFADEASSTPPEIQSAATTTATTTLESTSTSTPAEESTVIEEVDPSPTIISGDAVAMANILNMVNTNFINSNGVILFSNFFDYIRGSLDLRNASSSIFDGLCLTDNCSGNNTSINISNQSAINNFLLLQALTGGNSVENNTSTSTINSGDAYAGLNLVNIANTNFVDSEYLLLTMNAFKGVDGDIVFPSLSNFFDSLRSSSGSLQITNNAEVENNISTESATGGNEVEQGSIATGNADSSSNVFNQLNTTLVGGANVSILFRVHGDWAGEVFGAPDNLGWTQSPDGNIYLFDTHSTSSPQASSDYDISGSNSALIKNNVTVIALTGDNKITGPGTGIISTGNAIAGANIVNIANSNIIGRNWIMAIVNIFGDFKGNIAFGRPDLWVGGQVSAPQDIYKDTVLEYKFTVINNGDSPATKIKLTDNYGAGNLEIVDSSFQFEKDENGNLVWNIGSLQPGKATEITYKAKVTTDSNTDVQNIVNVSARETDNNPSDNTDTLGVTTKIKPTVRLGGSRRSGGGGGQVLGASTSIAVATSSLKSLQVLRLPPVAVAKNASTTVEQKLILTNPTDQTIKSVIFRDILKDRTGEPIHTEVWNLGDVLPHEEITLSYDLSFDSEAKKGFYSLTTRIESGAQKNNIGINGLVLLGSLADLFPASKTVKAKVATVIETAATIASIDTKPHIAFADDYSTATATTSSKGPLGVIPLTASFAIVPLLFLKLYQMFW
jgi:hypothetical protein